MPSLSGGRGLRQNLRMTSEVVCDGIPFGEGPVWCDDGTLVVTSVAEGALYRVEPDQNRATEVRGHGRWRERRRARGGRFHPRHAERRLRLRGHGAVRGASAVSPGDAWASARDAGRHSDVSRGRGVPFAQRCRGRVRRLGLLHRSAALPAAGRRRGPRHATRTRRHDRNPSRPASGTATASRSNPTAPSWSSSVRGCNGCSPTARASS